MANMRTISQDERAKLARAYMRGGMAPYQAARNTGFMRVGIMQEAIRAMEGREAEEAGKGASQTRFGPVVEEAPAETPVEKPEEISLPEEAAAICEEDEPENQKPIYPFLKPGEVKKAELELTMQTERLLIRLYEKDGRRLFQVTDRRTGHYLQLPQQVMRELKGALGLCLGAMSMQERSEGQCE
ncbi:MAG: hypothetical protein SOY30_07330 [Eubacteriales bacterium]|nr:hypothetical protein [Eubacteriales bacterium]